MNEDWSDREVELIIADYFAMLADEIKGIKFNKTRHRSQLLLLLDKRSNSAVEFKHRNISAVLGDMGLPFIKGYLPSYHFQGSKLIPKISKYLQLNSALEKDFADFSNNIPETKKSIEWDSLIVSPP